jgi:hypothetical protein
MMYADPTIEVKELTANEATPLPSSVGYSTMQRHLQQCILTYGCWANWYPWAQIGIAGNGQWGWAWGVG